MNNWELKRRTCIDKVASERFTCVSIQAEGLSRLNLKLRGFDDWGPSDAGTDLISLHVLQPGGKKPKLRPHRRSRRSLHVLQSTSKDQQGEEQHQMMKRRRRRRRRSTQSESHSEPRRRRSITALHIDPRRNIPVTFSSACPKVSDCFFWVVFIDHQAAGGLNSLLKGSNISQCDKH